MCMEFAKNASRQSIDFFSLKQQILVDGYQLLPHGAYDKEVVV